MDTALSIAAGVALAAACGFRVFVPLLAVSLAARAGQLPLAPGFQWLGTDAAAIALGTATILEVAAYYVPWLDHLLDGIGAPVATAAGVAAAAAVFADLPPLLRWTLAVVAGGGAAGAVHGATSLGRLKSLAFTAGLANPVVATAELGGAIATSVLALALPVAALAFLLAGLLLLAWAARRRRRAGAGDGAGPSGGKG